MPKAAGYIRRERVGAPTEAVSAYNAREFIFELAEWLAVAAAMSRVVSYRSAFACRRLESISASARSQWLSCCPSGRPSSSQIE